MFKFLGNKLLNIMNWRLFVRQTFSINISSVHHW